MLRVQPGRNVFPDGSVDVDGEAAAAKRNALVHLLDEGLTDGLQKVWSWVRFEGKRMLEQIIRAHRAKFNSLTSPPRKK